MHAHSNWRIPILDIFTGKLVPKSIVNLTSRPRKLEKKEPENFRQIEENKSIALENLRHVPGRV